MLTGYHLLLLYFWFVVYTVTCNTFGRAVVEQEKRARYIKSKATTIAAAR